MDGDSSFQQRVKLLERLRQPVWVFDIDNSRIVWGNPSCLSFWQADSLEELVSRDMASDMSETVARRLKQYQLDFHRDCSKQFCEIWTLYPNGEPVTSEIVYSGIQLDDGRMAMFCEVLQKKELDANSLRSTEALLHTSVMITLYSAAGVPLYRNPAARENVRSNDEKLEEHFTQSTMLNLLQRDSGDDINIVASVNTAEGHRWHDITARRCLDSVTGDQAWLISEVDVSKLKATEERAQFLAEHDTLTNLPNRNYVTIAFQTIIDRLVASGASGALIFIDLDHFKNVNDTLGHEAGDKLLIEVADRLKTLTRTEDVVARLGGDEFLLLLGPIDEDLNLNSFSNSLIRTLSQPIVLDGRDIKVTPSIGISLFPQDGRQIQDLMRHADLAMYHAKELGRNKFAFYSRNLSDAVETRINTENDLQTAIAQNQFVAYFQPRVDVATNQIIGAESLARWTHPTRGSVSPAEFIPICETSGLIGMLGKNMIEQSIRAQRAWSEHGFDISISVNLSPLQFRESTLVDDLMQIVEKQNANPRYIELEITESVLLGHDKSTIDKLHTLVDLGFRISIDDFGTGYSNLAYLHRYPIRCLKIDRSFVQALDPVEPILQLIISMAKLFNMQVVAEGVETQTQLERVSNFGCHEYQGFLFAKPMAFENFSNLLRTHNRQSA